MHGRTLIRVMLPRALRGLILAITALVCFGGATTPAMMVSMGQDCVGPACEDQICGEAAPPYVPSGFSVQLIMLSSAVERTPALARTETRSVGPPPQKAAQPSLAPAAPRSPPLA